MSSSSIISLTIAKILSCFGGTALPGLAALFICPALINQTAKKNKLKSIVVTGTNGKTSTAYLLRAVLSSQNTHFISNSSGSNLLRGIATALINQSDIFGNLKENLAVWEADEAAFPEAIAALNPKIIVIMNLSRDQLDRYGEVDTLLKLWQQGIDALTPRTRILVNRADRRLVGLKHPGLKFFGSKTPGVGLGYPQEYQGKFNQDTIWAAESLCQNLGINPAAVRTAARTIPATFGRGEVIKKSGQNWHIHLVKNPASLKAVWLLAKAYPLLIILNDNLADGTDVSWIWDVPFSHLDKRRLPIIVSGSRADDLALRLKYAGIPLQLIKVVPDINRAVAILTTLPGKDKYILPTYTAMLKLRRHLGLPSWN